MVSSMTCGLPTFATCRGGPMDIIDNGVSGFTWNIYSGRLMTLAGVYGFWKLVSKLERRETRRYLEKYALDEPNSLVPGSTFVFNCQMVNEGAIPHFSRNHDSRTVE
ncbi:hypothetical protein RND71_025093 [Anisodus tanguticus]|uniref:sucrose synthase n=1 Tax=Anisodus tanguticus TaxID=243964 RepID=A0AAE1V5H3_9SOLA|nr:hypothetical protein RND71_025093 [Anisodus tanguticus]